MYLKKKNFFFACFPSVCTLTVLETPWQEWQLTWEGLAEVWGKLVVDFFFFYKFSTDLIEGILQFLIGLTNSKVP